MLPDDKLPAAALLWSTLPDVATARSISAALVDQHLAACVCIIPGVESYFYWQNAVCSEQEVILLVKTSGAMVEACQRQLIALHPYDLPCVLQLSVSDGYPPFVRWLVEQTQGAQIEQQKTPRGPQL